MRKPPVSKRAIAPDVSTSIRQARAALTEFNQSLRAATAARDDLSQELEVLRRELDGARYMLFMNKQEGK